VKMTEKHHNAAEEGDTGKYQAEHHQTRVFIAAAAWVSDHTWPRRGVRLSGARRETPQCCGEVILIPVRAARSPCRMVSRRMYSARRSGVLSAETVMPSAPFGAERLRLHDVVKLLVQVGDDLRRCLGGRREADEAAIVEIRKA